MKMRPYVGLDDLARMKSLLVEKLKLTPHSAYHPGDLDWRLFIVSEGIDPAEVIRLWEDDAERLIGWLFIYRRPNIYDVVITPDVTEAVHSAILDEAEQYLASEQNALRMFVFENDAARRSLLEQRGYQKETCRVHFGMSLIGEALEPKLPPGFYFLDGQASDFAARRADAHIDAFQPGSTMTAQKYSSAMRAPSYDPTTDVVVTAPDGRFVAFALGWIDTASKIGMFEPVGTRLEYQRMGLGRAVLLESMRRMQLCGIETATVRTHLTLPGVIPFYESVGFRQMNFIYCYSRSPMAVS